MPHEPLPEFYAATQPRQPFVNSLFNDSAPDYDWVSGLMSFGSDRFYRKDALRRAGLQKEMRYLDVASGTGLMIKAALELGVAPSMVTGVDPSHGMLAQNRERNPVTLIEGRGEALPCASESFDFVSMGYALRHVEDLHKLFGELRRVLKPGGKVLILEITRPTNRAVLWVMRMYMQKLIPTVVWMGGKRASTAKLMEYYWATIEKCVPPAVILNALEAAGFKNVKRATQGTVLSEYSAER